jgi:hypothetical protein
MKFAILILTIIKMIFNLGRFKRRGGDELEVWFGFRAQIDEYAYDTMNILDGRVWHEKNAIIFLYAKVNKKKLKGTAKLYLITRPSGGEFTHLTKNNIEKNDQFYSKGITALVVKFNNLYDFNTDLTTFFVRGGPGGKSFFLKLTDKTPLTTVLEDYDYQEFLTATNSFIDLVIKNNYKYNEKHSFEVDQDLKDIFFKARNNNLKYLLDKHFTLEKNETPNIDRVYEFITSLYMTNSGQVAGKILDLVNSFNKLTTLLVEEQKANFIFAFNPNTSIIEEQYKAFEAFFRKNTNDLKKKKVEKAFHYYEGPVGELLTSIMNIVISEYKKIEFKTSGMYNYFALFLKYKYLGATENKNEFENEIRKYAKKIIDTHVSYLGFLSPDSGIPCDETEGFYKNLKTIFRKQESKDQGDLMQKEDFIKVGSETKTVNAEGFWNNLKLLSKQEREEKLLTTWEAVPDFRIVDNLLKKKKKVILKDLTEQSYLDIVQQSKNLDGELIVNEANELLGPNFILLSELHSFSKGDQNLTLSKEPCWLIRKHQLEALKQEEKENNNKEKTKEIPNTDKSTDRKNKLITKVKLSQEVANKSKQRDVDNLIQVDKPVVNVKYLS